MREKGNKARGKGETARPITIEPDGTVTAPTNGAEGKDG